MSDLYIYKCQSCKNKWFLDTFVSTDNRCYLCPHQSKLLEKSKCNCEIELLATGSCEKVYAWAHSLKLGLDSSFKGP